MNNRFPDICRANSDLVEYMFGNFFQNIIIDWRHFFQQAIISEPVLSKSVVVTGNDRMRSKIFYQEIAYIILGQLISKGFCEGDNNKVIHTSPSQQFNFLTERIDEADPKNG